MSKLAHILSLALFFALTVWTTAPAQAQVVRPFSSRFQANEAGDIRLIGNTVVSCSPALNASCTSARDLAGTPDVNNNDYFMVYVDVDSDPATFNSSTATATLPPGATVLWAGLYWGGETGGFGLDGLFAPDLMALNRVKLRAPGAAGYTTITASQCDNTVIGSEYGEYYQCFADITAQVSGTGSGAYTVADLQTSQGFNSHGGWGVVFVYRDPAEPTRNLVVYDGFAAVTTAMPPTSSIITINLSGFVTPFAGAVSTRVGVLAYEGDADLGNARLSLNNTFLSNAVNPANNTFNSTISQLGQHLVNKGPNYRNQLGFDADLLDASGVLGNNVSSASIVLETEGDFYYPGVVTFATEVYAPDFSTFDKDAVDVNGGELEPGDVIAYTFTLQNTGGDPADNVVLRDVLPAQVTLVPGSITVNGQARTEAADSDPARYTAGTRELVVNVGTGATSAAGGSVANGATVVVRFEATLNAGAMASASVINQGTLSYRGRTLNRSFQVFSDDPRTAGREGATILTVDSRPPAIDIASPAPGSVTGDATPTITGTAEVGATVTLRLNNGQPIMVMVDGQGNWSYTPPADLMEGMVTVVATARDRAGNTATDSTTVTIDLTAPALALTAPADGVLTRDPRPAITGTADPGAQVDVFIDGVKVATVNANGQGRWSYNIPQPLIDGMHTVRAETRDQVGNSASAQAAFTIDTMAPAVAITSPAGELTNNSTPTVVGTAEPGAQVTVEIGGQAVGTVTADGQGMWMLALPQPLPEGQTTIEAVATDAAGNEGSDTATVRVDTTPPVVTITAPADGEQIAGMQPVLRGTSDPGATVEVVLDGQVIGTTVADGQGRWALPVPAPLVPGLHSVAATSTDAAGNSAQATSTFTVEAPIADVVAITEPTDGATVADAQPFIRGTANPGAVVSVSVDGAEPVMVTADQQGNWSYRPPSALADGPHTVRASAGSASAMSSFTVAAPAPTLVITSPETGATVATATPTITGTADPNAVVTIIVDGQPAGTVMADAQGMWSYSPATPLGDGQHTVIVTAQGPTGQTVMDSVTFEVDAVPDVDPDMGGEVDMGGQPDMGGAGQDSDYVVTGTGCAQGAGGAAGGAWWVFVALGLLWRRRCGASMSTDARCGASMSTDARDRL